MRKTTILLGILVSGGILAQEGRVGINTENPNATFEVAGQPKNATVVDGIIAPKIDGPDLRAKSDAYGVDQKGAIVYVTGPVRIPANRVGKVRNVDSAGYYYFDGEVWVKFRPEATTYTAGDGIAINNGVISSTAPTYTAGDNITITGNVISANVPTYTAGNGINIDENGQITATGENTNLYTNDGTLAGNRTVTMGNNTLKFTGNITSFVRNAEAIALKSATANQSNFIGFYKNGEGGARSGNLGFGSSTHNNFNISNELGDRVVITANNREGNATTELASKLKINNLPVEHNANNALLVTDQQGNVKKANLYQAGAGISIDPNTNTISATATASPEPWNIQGGTTQATANNQNIYQNGTVGIGNFSNQTATNTLDINGSLRIRDLEPEHGRNLYNLAADENGVVIRISPQNFVEAGSVFASNYKDVNVTDGGNSKSNTDLGITKRIVIPKGRKYGIMLQVSVPMGVITGVGDYLTLRTTDNQQFRLPKRYGGYFGVKISMAENGGSEQFLNEVSRKVAIPERADHTLYSMTTVNSQYYGVIDNSNGTVDKEVVFKVYGYTESGYRYGEAIMHNNYTVRFNMYNSNLSDNSNYNWGSGSLNYQIYSVQ